MLTSQQSRRLVQCFCERGDRWEIPNECRARFKLLLIMCLLFFVEPWWLTHPRARGSAHEWQHIIVPSVKWALCLPSPAPSATPLQQRRESLITLFAHWWKKLDCTKLQVAPGQRSCTIMFTADKRPQWQWNVSKQQMQGWVTYKHQPQFHEKHFQCVSWTEWTHKCCSCTITLMSTAETFFMMSSCRASGPNRILTQRSIKSD